jgi:transposase-like protein
LQLDVKFLERIAGTGKRLYQFTAIDDCTRIRVLKIYDACNQTAAIRFVGEVIRRLPFRVLVIQTDNGAEFQSASTGISKHATSAMSISDLRHRT